MKLIKEKLLIGWKEWCSLPQLSLPAIKAKIDTGAETSSLHAEGIQLSRINGDDYVTFLTSPFPSKHGLLYQACAQLIDERVVISSNGQKESRYVIKSDLSIGGIQQNIELTLTSRHLMRFNLLLGRQALRKFALIDSSKTYCQGRLTRAEINQYYSQEKNENCYFSNKP